MRLLYSEAHFHETSGLAARQFGMWNMLSCIVQIHAGLFPHDRGAYNVALWSFVLVLLHFLWERVADRTVGGRSLLAAEGFAFVSFCWMMVQREVYVGYGKSAAMTWVPGTNTNCDYCGRVKGGGIRRQPISSSPRRAILPWADVG